MCNVIDVIDVISVFDVFGMFDMFNVSNVFDVFNAFNVFYIISDITYIVLLAFISAFDVKYRKIPNKASILILLLSLIKTVVTFNIDAVYSSVGGFLIALIFVGIPYIIRENMGAGDLKLVAFSGIYWGFYQTLTLLALSYISCALFAIIINIFKKITKKPKITTLPFAPFVLFGSLYLFVINYFLK